MSIYIVCNLQFFERFYTHFITYPVYVLNTIWLLFREKGLYTSGRELKQMVEHAGRDEE